ncbi:MAG TPA: hypothetical protein VHA78_01005 [Candidatus Peribacteraceae bacterium]|nr:hypothetical protein [Candidatus Peribacteraceae bacterium]
MKKLSLLLGTLGGAMAGYIFSNSKLREELATAKDPEQAGKILAKHLQKDGKQLGHEVQQFAKSDVVQDNLKKASQYAQKTFTKAKKDLTTMVKSGKAKTKTTAHKAASKAKSATAKKSK